MRRASCAALLLVLASCQSPPDRADNQLWEVARARGIMNAAVRTWTDLLDTDVVRVDSHADRTFSETLERAGAMLVEMEAQIRAGRRIDFSDLHHTLETFDVLFEVAKIGVD